MIARYLTNELFHLGSISNIPPQAAATSPPENSTCPVPSSVSPNGRSAGPQNLPASLGPSPWGDGSYADKRKTYMSRCIFK